MDLNVKDWKEFRVGDILNCESTILSIKDDLLKGSIPFVSRTAENNGIDGYVDITANKVIDGNCLTIGAEGIYAFYQPNPFATGNKVYQLRCDNMNLYVGLFITTILNFADYKYSYGRARILSKLKDEIIKLPADASGNPDWQFMEDYIKSLHHKLLTTQNKLGNVPALNVQDWKEFKVKDLFLLQPTKGIVTDELIEGNEIPYMAAKHDANGITMICQKDGIEDWISKGNCIVFINLGEGSVGFANYIKEDFIGMSGKTTCGYNSNLNEYNGLFISTILSQERPKYSFGRSWTGERLLNTTIKLPVDKNGNPDWQFMEDYIKSLPYGDRLAG